MPQMVQRSAIALPCASTHAPTGDIAIAAMVAGRTVRQRHWRSAAMAMGSVSRSSTTSSAAAAARGSKTVVASGMKRSAPPKPAKPRTLPAISAANKATAVARLKCR